MSIPTAKTPVEDSPDQDKAVDDSSGKVLATGSTQKLLLRQMEVFRWNVQERERLEKENRRLREEVARIGKLFASHRSSWDVNAETVKADVSMLARELHFYRMESLSETRATNDRFKEMQLSCTHRIAERDNFKARLQAANADLKREQAENEHLRTEMDYNNRDVILADKAKNLAEKNLNNALFIQTQQKCMKCKVSEKQREKLHNEVAETINAKKQSDRLLQEKEQLLAEAKTKVVDLEACVLQLENDMKKMEFERNAYKNDNVRLLGENESFRQDYGLPKTPQRLYSPVISTASQGIQTAFETSSQAVQTAPPVVVVSCGVQTEAVTPPKADSKMKVAAKSKDVDMRGKIQTAVKAKEGQKKPSARTPRLPTKRSSREACLSPPPLRKSPEDSRRLSYWDIRESDARRTPFSVTPQPTSHPQSHRILNSGIQGFVRGGLRLEGSRPTDHFGSRTDRQSLFRDPPAAYPSTPLPNQQFFPHQQGPFQWNSVTWNDQPNYGTYPSMNNRYQQPPLQMGPYQGNLANPPRGVPDRVRWSDLPN